MELMKKKFHIIAIVCIFLFGMALSPKELQNDTFYTIKIGEYVMENGIGNLTEDPFSWHDLSYTFPHWLYDTFIYNIYNILGMDGLYLSTIFLTAFLGLLIYFISTKKSNNPVISLILTLIGLYVLQPYLAVRAQLVTFCLFVLTIYFIDEFLEKARIRDGIALLVIPTLIANLHLAVWPFYFVLFLPYIAEYIFAQDWFSFNILLYIKMLFFMIFNKEDKIKDIKRKIEGNKQKREKIKENPYKIIVEKNKNVKYLIIIFLLATLTGLLTPTGTTPYTYLLKTYQGNTTEVINEHGPLTIVTAPGFAFSLIMFFGLLIFTDTKIKLRDFLFFAGLTYLALKSRRQISMFVIICYPILIKMISELFKKHDSKYEESLLKIFTNYFGAVISMGLVIIIGLFIYKPQVNATYVNEGLYPVHASKWIKENLNLDEIRLFNEYNYGSYLLYEDIPVMIDSRADLYAPEFNTKTGKREDGVDIFMDVQNVVTLSTNYEKVFEKYDITHVILHKNSKLALMLKKDSKYKRIYYDDSFIIFERKK
ncbi:MAG: hypothetical protein IKF52_02915 [Clostridia bacterium]|nr:hypothetical protein [Clostridia bacterium]